MSFKIYIDQFPNYDNNPDQGKRKHDDSKIIELEFTIKFQRKPTHFSRWMNFDNIFLSGIWWFKIKVIYLYCLYKIC